MKKTQLEKFISKYNLAGTAETVTWTAKSDGTLATRFISEDKSAIGEVVAKNIELDAGSYSIFETKTLQSLLAVLGDDISVQVQSRQGKSIGLLFKDSSSKVVFVLADPTNIPKVPESRGMPEFDNVISIDSTFIERFIRAKNALPDVETFTVLSDGTAVDVVLGFSDMNTNRVTLKVTTQRAEKMEPIDFHARYLKEMLVANKEAKSGKLEVSSEGLARVTFEMEDFDVTYWLPQVHREN
jgi:hypothetical protein